MFLSRQIDDREIQLKRQNKIFFQISGAGHEAVLVAAGLVLKSGYDWFFPYYRDRALALMVGETPYEMLLQGVGAKDDPASGGRQMPSHWGNPKFNLVTGSSPTGTRWLHAVGPPKLPFIIRSSRRRWNRRARPPAAITLIPVRTKSPTFPEAKEPTSEGEFFEALNAACLGRLPVLFSGGRQRLRHFRAGGIPDGGRQHFASGSQVFRTCTSRSATAPIRSKATRRCSAPPPIAARARGRPWSTRTSRAPIRTRFPTMKSFTRPPRSAKREARRDPVPKFALFLVREGILDEAEMEALEAEVDREMSEATDRALAAEPPAADSIYVDVYSPDVDPTSSSSSKAAAEISPAQPKTMVEIISATLLDEMARDERIVVFGEDVADCSREENLSVVKGKGGVFKATAGIAAQIRLQRVFNTPIAEAAIVGRAIGMALRGMKPVAEIQFFDYIWPAMMQIPQRTGHACAGARQGISSAPR